jgi:lipopolysaccharide transport system permease protein
MGNRIVIEAEKAGGNYWKDVFTYKGLLYFLAWRDVTVRYKQTVIGVAWALIRPLLTIVVFTFLGSIYGTDTNGVSRILAVTAATIPWQLFSAALNDSSNSLVANTNLITKVYFPRIIIPLSTVLVCLLDFALSLLILAGLMLYNGHAPTWTISFLPLFILLTVIGALGFGLFFGALNVKYRDFRYALPFLIQLGLFLSPIAFSSSDIFNRPELHEAVKYLYSLNPMVAVIEGFRWCLLGGTFSLELKYFVVSCSVSFVAIVCGITYFRNTEKTFADQI